MKLLHRTTRDFLIATCVVLLITGIVLYQLLQQEVTNEMNEQLSYIADRVSKEVENGKAVNYPFAQVTPTTDAVRQMPVYGDTTLYDELQQLDEDYHYLDVIKDIRGQRYHIKVMTIYIGWSEYYTTIFYIFLAALVLLAGSGVVITYFSNKKIWRPFFKNLERLKQYSVSSPTPITLEESPITEFRELQDTLKDLTDRGHREYTALRAFTENASHELQTPLGIILSKLDRLSQLEVTEEMANYIEQTRTAVERLTKMNKNLLLLAKLDNQAFEQKLPVRLDEVIGQQVSLMQDLFAAKNIEIHTALEPTAVVADLYLCDVLVSNLLSNALRYTPAGGKVQVALNASHLTISNAGEPLDFPPSQLFERFKKSTRHVQSTGLGLAIVQQIGAVNNWTIHYDYANGLHQFTIHF